MNIFAVLQTSVVIFSTLSLNQPCLDKKDQNLMFKGAVYLCTDCFGRNPRVKATMGVLITTITITTTITISLIFIFLTPSP